MQTVVPEASFTTIDPLQSLKLENKSVRVERVKTGSATE